jgi:tripartite-type tricarboxylate transporter receptor subunit TctC
MIDRRHPLAVGAAALAAPAQTQGTFPTRPVRLVVAFPPGGPTDGSLEAYADYRRSGIELWAQGVRDSGVAAE